MNNNLRIQQPPPPVNQVQPVWSIRSPNVQQLVSLPCCFGLYVVDDNIPEAQSPRRIPNLSLPREPISTVFMDSPGGLAKYENAITTVKSVISVPKRQGSRMSFRKSCTDFSGNAAVSEFEPKHRKKLLNPYAKEFIPGKKNATKIGENHFNDSSCDPLRECLNKMEAIGICLILSKMEDSDAIQIKLVTSFPEVLAKLYSLLDQESDQESGEALEETGLSNKKIKTARAKDLVKRKLVGLELKETKRKIESKFSEDALRNMNGEKRNQLALKIGKFAKTFKKLLL